MAYDPSKLPLNQARRGDRAVDDAFWIKHMLHTAAVGSMATVAQDQPFINTNLYVYDEAENAIYTHTARAGRTRFNLKGGAKVCFSVFSMGRLLPAEVALEFSVEYASVVVFGRASLVEDEREALGALQRLLDKYAPHLAPGADYCPPTLQELQATSVFKLAIDSWSAKRKEVAPDFPGAYRFEPVGG